MFELKQDISKEIYEMKYKRENDKTPEETLEE